MIQVCFQWPIVSITNLIHTRCLHRQKPIKSTLSKNLIKIIPRNLKPPSPPPTNITNKKRIKLPKPSTLNTTQITSNKVNLRTHQNKNSQGKTSRHASCHNNFRIIMVFQEYPHGQEGVESGCECGDQELEEEFVVVE